MFVCFRNSFICRLWRIHKVCKTSKNDKVSIIIQSVSGNYPVINLSLFFSRIVSKGETKAWKPVYRDLQTLLKPLGIEEQGVT
jgi:hypothetical protein